MARRSRFGLVEPAHRRPPAAAHPHVRPGVLVDARRRVARRARLRARRRHRGRLRGVGGGGSPRRARTAARARAPGHGRASMKIDRDRLVETASRMIGVHSFTGSEQAMAELMASLYEQMVLHVQWQQVEDTLANAVGTWVGAG